MYLLFLSMWRFPELSSIPSLCLAKLQIACIYGWYTRNDHDVYHVHKCNINMLQSITLACCILPLVSMVFSTTIPTLWCVVL